MGNVSESKKFDFPTPKPSVLLSTVSLLGNGECIFTLVVVGTHTTHLGLVVLMLFVCFSFL